MLYTKKNWAKGKIANTLDDFSTVLEMQLGHTLPKNGTFPIVVWNAISFPDPGDDPGVEIVVATYIGLSSNGTDVYQIARGQDSTIPSSHFPGSQVALNITAGVGYADLGVVGTKDVDETGMSDMSALIYDIVLNKLRYKPVIMGCFDNDLRMFLLIGADNITLSVSEVVLLLEVVIMNDIIIELGVIYEETYAWDVLVSLSLDALYINMVDDVAVNEQIQMLDIVVELGIYEDISVSDVLEFFGLDILNIEFAENITISEMNDFSGANVSDSESLGVSEDATVDLEINTEGEDFISASEDVSVGLDELNLEIGEDSFVSEDAVSEVETNAEVSDDVSVSEDFAFVFELNFEADDDSFVSEDASVSLDELNVEADDGSSIYEDTSIGLDELNLEIGDDSLISEYFVASFDNLGLEVGDDNSVVEDLVADMEINFDAFDSLTGQEVLELDLTLTLDGSDSVVISEDYSYDVL